MQTYRLHKKHLYYIIIIFAVAFTPLFVNLSKLHMQRWDEARLAVSAYEMSVNNNWIVPTYCWQPDMYSVKPPLQIWLMAVSIKVFGANEYAIRLPSALAALFTCLFLYWFLAIKLRNNFIALLAPVLLLAADGYVRIHGTRTNDYDTLLTLFTTITVCHFYLFINNGNRKHLIYSAIALALASLTKGIAPLMFIPGLFLAVIYFQKLKDLLTSKHFYIAIVVFIIPVFGYYLLREHYNQGYLHSVSVNELGGRFLSTLENHKHPWYFYLVRLIERDHIWFIIALSAPAIAAYTKNLQHKTLAIYCTIIAFSFLVIISAAGTKLDWYNMPMYPLLCIMAAIVVQEIFAITQKLPQSKRAVLTIALSLLFLYSYGKIIKLVLYPKVDLNNPDVVFANYIHTISRDKNEHDIVLPLGNNQQELVWYEHTNPNVNIKSPDNFSTGDIIVSYENLSSVTQKHTAVLQKEINGLLFYKIQ